MSDDERAHRRHVHRCLNEAGGALEQYAVWMRGQHPLARVTEVELLRGLATAIDAVHHDFQLFIDKENA